jgi:hypothetical protein
MGKALPVSPADYFSSHLAMCREVKFQSNIHTIANRRTFRHSSHESPKRTKKRRRTTLSCITCHQRKVRCDRKLPCTSCVGYGTKDICSFYVDALRRRKSDTNSIEPAQWEGPPAFDSTLQADCDTLRKASFTSMSSDVGQSTPLSSPRQIVDPQSSRRMSPADGFQACQQDNCPDEACKAIPGYSFHPPLTASHLEEGMSSHFMRTLFEDAAGRDSRTTSSESLFDFICQAGSTASSSTIAAQSTSALSHEASSNSMPTVFLHDIDLNTPIAPISSLFSAMDIPNSSHPARLTSAPHQSSHNAFSSSFQQQQRHQVPLSAHHHRQPFIQTLSPRIDVFEEEMQSWFSALQQLV